MKIPHQPVYLDTSTDADLLSRFATRLSEQLGYPYAHGRVYSAIQNSGAGYSPKTRRQLQDAQTPWGSGEFIDLLPGIEYVETHGHGGFRLSAQRLAQMPSHLRMEGGWYEEDGEYLLAALVFDDFATLLDVEQLAVLEYLGIVHRDYPDFGNPDMTPEERRQKLVAERRSRPKARFLKQSQILCAISWHVCLKIERRIKFRPIKFSVSANGSLLFRRCHWLMGNGPSARLRGS